MAKKKAAKKKVAKKVAKKKVAKKKAENPLLDVGDVWLSKAASLIIKSNS